MSYGGRLTRMSTGTRDSMSRGRRGSRSSMKRFLPAPAMDAVQQNQNNMTDEEIDSMLKSIFRDLAKSSKDDEEAFISPEALKDAFKSQGHSTDDTLVQLLIDDVDENGDGKIGWDEFHLIMKKCLFSQMDELLQAFEIVDSDGDGYIPTVEFKRIFMTEGSYPLSDREADELMIFADSDGDGLVDYRSFLTWLNNPDKIVQT